MVRILIIVDNYQNLYCERTLVDFSDENAVSYFKQMWD